MVSRRPTRPDEFALIARYFRPLASGAGAFGLADDAASYRAAPGKDLVLTVDTVAAGVHFNADDPPASIARKALRVNLSDLAAKGATAVGYLLALALPDDWSEQWMGDFVAGLAQDQETYEIDLLGGDTTKASGGLTVTITAIGEVPKGEMVLRSGACPGDAILVSGTIGDAALGLKVLRDEISASGVAAERLLDRYRHPQPRMALAPVLRHFANCAMDVSDGLVGDLAHICAASGVGALIEASKVPLSEAARTLLEAGEQRLETVLTGGDDYEILATVPAGNVAAFVSEAESAGVSITQIGQVVAGKGPPVVHGGDGTPLVLAGIGHTHF